MLLKSQWSSHKAHGLSLRAIDTDLWTCKPDTGMREVGSAWLGSEKEKTEPCPAVFLHPYTGLHPCNPLCWKYHTRSFPPHSFQLNIATLEKPPCLPLPHLSSDHCLCVCFLEIPLLWVCLKLIYQKFNLQVDDDGRWGSMNGLWVLRMEVS